MANTNAPFGFRPASHLHGADFNAAIRSYTVPAGNGTALFTGMAVKHNSSLSAGPDGALRPECIAAAAGDTLLGFIVGFEPLYTSLNTKHRVASTLRTVYVADDPGILFEAQEDSAGAALVADDVGSNGDLVVGSGSTSTGLAASLIDSSDVHTNAGSPATAQLRLHSFVNDGKNAIGNYAKWIVFINEHVYKATTGV